MTADLGWDVIYQLLRFRWNNTPSYLRSGLAEPVEDQPIEVPDEELRSLILYAHSQFHGDPTNPRQLEAYRVMWLVPVEIGARLFGVERTSSDE